MSKNNKLPKILKGLLTTTSIISASFLATNSYGARMPGVLYSSPPSPSNAYFNKTDWKVGSPSGSNSNILNHDTLFYNGNHTFVVDSGTWLISTISPNGNSSIGPINIQATMDGPTSIIVGSIADNTSSSMVNVSFDSSSSDMKLYLANPLPGSFVNSTLYPFGLANYNRLGSVDFNSTDSAVYIWQSANLPTTFKSSGLYAGSIKIGMEDTEHLNINFNGAFDPNNPISRLNIYNAEVGLNTNLTLKISGENDIGNVYIDGVDGDGSTNFTKLNVANNVSIYANLWGDSIYLTSSVENAPIPNTAIIFAGNSSVAGRIERIEHVEINNGTVELNKGMQHSNVLFNNNNATLKLSGDTFGDDGIRSTYIRTNTPNTGTIEINALSSFLDTNFADSGTGNYLKAISFLGDKMLITTNPVYANEIAPITDGQGSFIIAPNLNDANDGQIDIPTNLGTSTKKLKEVGILAIAFDQNPDEGPYGSTSIRVKENVSIYADELSLKWFFPEELVEEWVNQLGGLWTEGKTPYYNSDGVKIALEDGVTIDAPITTMPPYDFDLGEFTTDPFGVVVIQGNATLKGQIGTDEHQLSTVDVSNNGKDIRRFAEFWGDVYTESFQIKDGAIAIENDITIRSNDLSLTYDSSINLKDHTLRLIGSTTQLYEDTDSTIDLTITNTKNGNIIVSKGTDFDMVDVNSCIINLTDKFTLLNQSKSYNIFSSENAGTFSLMDDSKVTFQLENDNPFNEWSYSNGVITLTSRGDPGEIISGITGSNPNIDTILNSDAQQDLVTTVVFNPDDAAELLKRTESNQTIADGAGIIVKNIQQEVTSPIENRISSVAGPDQFSDLDDGKISSDKEGNPYSLGIAAGNAYRKYGTWVGGFIGSDDQKKIGNHAGYSAKSWGFSLGADTELESVNLIGAALSYGDATVNHKDANDGDKTYAKSYVLSLYGLQELNDKWSFEGVMSYSKNKVDNRENRIVVFNRQIARANYSFNSLSAGLYFNYDSLLSENVLFTPNVGLALTRNDALSYQESGATVQNLYVKKKAEYLMEAIAGAELMLATSNSDTNLVPELHGEIRYDFSNKKNLLTATLPNSQPLVVTGPSVERLSSNIGFGLNIRSKKIDTALVYDLFLAKKYVGHQGAIKLRLNF